MKNLADKILKKIKKEKIKPTSKYYYLGLSVVKWIIFGFSSLFGGMALSVTIYWLSDEDMFVSFRGLPLYWIVLFCVFLALAYFDFKKTEKGYKYDFVKVVLAEVAVVAVLGIFLFGIGFAERFETFSARHVPFYRGFGESKMMMWGRADDGFLGGKVLEYDDKMMDLELEDFVGEMWDVDLRNAVIDERLKMDRIIGRLIKMRGDIESPRHFKAEFVGPFGEKGIKLPPLPPPLPLP